MCNADLCTSVLSLRRKIKGNSGTTHPPSLLYPSVHHSKFQMEQGLPQNYCSSSPEEVVSKHNKFCKEWASTDLFIANMLLSPLHRCHTIGRHPLPLLVHPAPLIATLPPQYSLCKMLEVRVGKTCPAPPLQSPPWSLLLPNMVLVTLQLATSC